MVVVIGDRLHAAGRVIVLLHPGAQSFLVLRLVVGELLLQLAGHFEHAPHGAGALGDDEPGIEVDHDHAVVGLHEFEHVVRDVAGVIGDAAGRGVREDHRGFRDLERRLHAVR